MDRLRRHNHLVQQEVRQGLPRLRGACLAGDADTHPGLAVVRMFVEQSGGSVTAHSFVVTRPRYPVDDFLI